MTEDKQFYKIYEDLGFERIDMDDTVLYSVTGYTGFILSKRINENAVIEVVSDFLDRPKLYIAKEGDYNTPKAIELTIEDVENLFYKLEAASEDDIHEAQGLFDDDEEAELDSLGEVQKFLEFMQQVFEVFDLDTDFGKYITLLEKVEILKLLQDSVDYLRHIKLATEEDSPVEKALDRIQDNLLSVWDTIN